MLISLFPTPLDHFHFHPTSGPAPDLILSYRLLYLKPKFPELMHIKEFCRVKCCFSGNAILCPPSADGWDDADAHKLNSEVFFLVLFTSRPQFQLG